MVHQIQEKIVSRETLDYVNALIEVYEKKLNEYVELLLWWNEKVNLLSRKTNKIEVEKHVVHSLLISCAGAFPKENILVDIGSGGGLPGIPLAICYPQKEYVLVDRVAKKTAAASDIISQLGLKNVSTVTKDMSEFHVEHPVSWISKHAVKIGDFISSTEKQEWNNAYFLKGEDYQDELHEITTPLSIMVYKIDALLKDPFYSGKRLLLIKPGI